MVYNLGPLQEQLAYIQQETSIFNAWRHDSFTMGGQPRSWETRKVSRLRESYKEWI